MAVLPDPDLTVAAIDQYYEAQRRKIPPRDYLGGSEIGEDCYRMLWYRFRHVRQPKFPGRILRLFETGNITEDRIVRILRIIGLEVLSVDPNTGRQWEYKDCNDHLQIHLDGAVLGLLEAPKTWHLLEVKSANQKYHNELVKYGVKKKKPVHWDQMQLGMGMSGLKRAVYISVCKNDDSIYFERVKFDKAAYEGLLRKARTIINAESPPERLGKKPDFYKCRFCDMSSFCWGKEWPDVNCRTCAHSSPVEDGNWACAMGHDGMPCAEHIYLPTMIHWAEPIDGSPVHVRYRADDYEFVNCAATGFPGAGQDHYHSQDLWDSMVEF
jgi:hypothetical protein